MLESDKLPQQNEAQQNYVFVSWQMLYILSFARNELWDLYMKRFVVKHCQSKMICNKLFANGIPYLTLISKLWNITFDFFYRFNFVYNGMALCQEAKLTLCQEAKFTLPILCMMTSSNGSIFRITGHLCGEFTDGWIPRTKASDGELWCFLWSMPEWTVE